MDQIQLPWAHVPYGCTTLHTGLLPLLEVFFLRLFFTYVDLPFAVNRVHVGYWCCGNALQKSCVSDRNIYIFFCMSIVFPHLIHFRSWNVPFKTISLWLMLENISTLTDVWPVMFSNNKNEPRKCGTEFSDKNSESELYLFVCCLFVCAGSQGWSALVEIWSFVDLSRLWLKQPFGWFNICDFFVPSRSFYLEIPQTCMFLTYAVDLIVIHGITE